MPDIGHLDGLIYHMVHFENLQSIFLRKALLSKEKVFQEGIEYQSIAFEEVQSLRERVFIWDFSTNQFRSLHSYVPFYFATRTPMLHVQYRRGDQNEIVFFEVSRSILKDRGVVFTDGNASNQQLSKYGIEKVLIIPATVMNDNCRRKYIPNGPHGTSIYRSDFYGDVAFLDHLDWDGLNNRRRIDPIEEYIRVRHAEVLVPDIVPLGRLKGISVRTQEMVQIVNQVILESGLAGRIPSVVCKPWFFFA